MMKGRFLLIALAAAVALVVLLVTLWLPGPHSSGARTSTIEPSLSQLPTGLDRDQVRNGSSALSAPTAGDYEYHFKRNGRPIDIFGATLTPLPDWVSEVTEPEVRIHLDAGRLLRITAQEGTFVAPENDPRSGQLVGDVVISLYESVEGQPLDLSPHSRDRLMKVELDDAQFDLERGRIESDGPVAVIGERVEFLGRGLGLTYNEKRRRVDHLEITHGQRMTIRVEPDDVGGATTSESPTESASEEGLPRRAQFYLATFHSNVALTDQQMNLSGDELDLVFSLDTRSQRRGSKLPTHAPRLNDSDAGSADTSDQEKDPPRTITVTWDGSLIVTPQDPPPSDLAGPDDVRITVVGRPVRLVGSDGGRTTAAKADYLLSSGRLRMVGSGAYPLKLDKADLGVLHGERLDIRPEANVASIIGPGSFFAYGHPSLVDRINAGGDSIPSEMAVKWQEQLDLLFYGYDSDDNSPGQGSLRALRQIDVRGEVNVDDPAFELNSDSLSLRFAHSAERAAALRKILATGNVHVETAADQHQPAMDIGSERLQIDLMPQTNSSGDIDLRPTQLTATGSVTAREPGRTIRTGKLVVGMTGVRREPPEPPSDGGSAGASPSRSSSQALAPIRESSVEGEPSVSTVNASDGVRIEVDNPPVKISAERMVVDAQSRQADLYGTDSNWVRVERDNGYLEGPHLVLIDDNAKTMRGIGPGRAQFMRPNGNATPSAAAAQRPDRWNVTWREGMNYDHTHGQARFLGDVAVKAVSGDTRCSFKANDLRMAFDLETEASGAVEVGEVKAVYAQGNVVFLAEKFAQRDDSQEPILDTAIRIAGPLLDYDNQSQQIHVIGEGTMLLMDHRKRAQVQTDDALDPKVVFVGGGDTVFSFKRKLVLDAKENDLRMSGQVTMVHESLSTHDLVQMECEQLVANFKPTGGMGTWLSGDKPQPEIIAVLADGNVIVSRDDKSIRAGHLTYEGATQTITFRPDEDGYVELVDPERILLFEEFSWDLMKNKYHFDKPGAVRVPVP